MYAESGEIGRMAKELESGRKIAPSKFTFLIPKRKLMLWNQFKKHEDALDDIKQVNISEMRSSARYFFVWVEIRHNHLANLVELTAQWNKQFT
jgi:hypothetical protein